RKDVNRQHLVFSAGCAISYGDRPIALAGHRHVDKGARRRAVLIMNSVGNAYRLTFALPKMLERRAGIEQDHVAADAHSTLAVGCSRAHEGEHVAVVDVG